MQFTKKFFDTIYPRNETIDGDFNAREHAYYLQSLFELMGYHPTRVYDYGFGKGNLLKEVSSKLGCTYVGGCDVSEYALEKLQKKSFAKDWHLRLSSVSAVKIPKKTYHLGLCNSVLQYLDDKEAAKAVKVLAKSCKYVYLHVPTSEDYKILRKDINFEDPYAFHRSRKFYSKILAPHFNLVSWGVLESRHFSSHKTSVFTDAIYRFGLWNLRF